MSLFLEGYIFQREFPQQSHWDLTDIVLPLMPSPSESEGQGLVLKCVRPRRTPAWTRSWYGHKAPSYGCGRAVNGLHRMKNSCIARGILPGYFIKMCHKMITQGCKVWTLRLLIYGEAESPKRNISDHPGERSQGCSISCGWQGNLGSPQALRHSVPGAWLDIFWTFPSSSSHHRLADRPGEADLEAGFFLTQSSSW